MAYIIAFMGEVKFEGNEVSKPSNRGITLFVFKIINNHQCVWLHSLSLTSYAHTFVMQFVDITVWHIDLAISELGKNSFNHVHSTSLVFIHV